MATVNWLQHSSNYL